MGFRISWIARSGTSTKELLEASTRHLTGERHDCPDIGFYLLELPKSENGPWVVLIADGSENFAELDDSLAESLSKDGSETLYFWCSDTVMATELMCFKNGQVTWSIEYGLDEQSRGPTLDGDVPAFAHKRLVVLEAMQHDDSGVDYVYDLTAELGHRLVGFRHDTELEVEDPEPFQVLAR